MRSIGQKFREARESKGLTLSDVAAMTRIPRTTLQMIESDRFDEFRNSVFVKGHIRSYARELGLAPEAIVLSYEKAVGFRAQSADSVEILRPAHVPTVRADGLMDVVRDVWKRHVRPTHVLALALVLTGVVIFASLLSGTRATAEDPADFPEANQHDWEIEQDVQETRWLLERPLDDKRSR